MDSELWVKFWGTRGSGPAPFGDRMRYGGNTSCVSVGFDGGLAVFDAGTGLIALGRWLEEAGRQGSRDPAEPVHIFIGHVHLDHIQGLFLFPWLFRKEAVIHIYGSGGGEASLEERLSLLCGPPYWPAPIGQVPATVVWHEISAGETVVLSERTRIRAERACHPNGGLLYRLEDGGRSVVYGLDCELGDGCESERDVRPMWERYREFARGCGLLIFDAPYTEEEYPAYRGFGHSFWQQGVQMAKECGAGRLCISHHDWGRTDEELAGLERLLEERAAALGVAAEFAREGMRIALPAGANSPAVTLMQQEER